MTTTTTRPIRRPRWPAGVEIPADPAENRRIRAVIRRVRISCRAIVSARRAATAARQARVTPAPIRFESAPAPTVETGHTGRTIDRPRIG